MNSSKIIYTIPKVDLKSYCCVVHSFEKYEAPFRKQEILDRTKSCFDEIDPSKQLTLLKSVLQAFQGFNTSIKFIESDCEIIHQESKCSMGVQLEYIGYVCFLLLVFLIAFVGNSAVILSVFSSKTLRKTKTNYFIASLAFSDLLLSIFVLPVKIKTATNNLFFCASVEVCRLYVTVDIMLFTASITNLFAISIDRFVALDMPYAYPTLLTSKRVKLSIFSIWFYAVAWGIVGNFNWENYSQDAISVTPGSECVTNDRIQVMTAFVIIFYLPVFVMGLIYGRIFQIAQRHARSIAKQRTKRQNSPNLSGIRTSDISTRTYSMISQNSPVLGTEAASSLILNVKPHNSPKLSPKMRASNGTRLKEERTVDAMRKTSLEVRRKYMVRLRAMSTNAAHAINKTVMLKVTKTVAIVYGLFLFCWLPVSILSIGLHWWPSYFQSTSDTKWRQIVFADVLPLLNSTLNPFVYAFMSKTYRRAFRTLLWKVMPCLKVTRTCFWVYGAKRNLNEMNLAEHAV